jgi:hypothetical protein
LGEADEAFAGLHQSIDGLTEDQMLEVWLGTWSIREILIHISGWHRAMIPALARIARGDSPYPEGTSYDDFNAWNARFVEEKTGVKLADVLAELDLSHRALVDAAAGVPEEYFAAGAGARDLFDGIATAHYREHAEQIRDRRKIAAR